MIAVTAVGSDADTLRSSASPSLSLADPESCVAASGLVGLPHATEEQGQAGVSCRGPARSPRSGGQLCGRAGAAQKRVSMGLDAEIGTEWSHGPGLIG